MSEEYSSRTGWTTRANPEDITLLAKAMVKAQSQIEGAKKDKKANYGKYADLASVWEACKDALTKNGLSVIQMPCVAPEGHIGLITIILHESGQCISERFHMPVRDKTNAQAVGSAITYARRYALAAAVGVCPDDDDGNAAIAAPGKTGPNVGTPVTKAYESAADSLGHIATDNLRSQYEAKFAAAKGEVAQKLVYSEVRNGKCPEPLKSELLKKFGDAIKAGEKK